jgi:hypothetical protein
VLLAACRAQNERVYQLVHRRTLASEPLPADVMDKFRWVKQQTKSVVRASYVQEEQVIVEFVASYLSHVTFPKSQHLRDKLSKDLGPLEDSIVHLSRAVIPYEGDVIGVYALDMEVRR